MAVSGSSAIIGAPGADGIVDGSGAAYVLGGMQSAPDVVVPQGASGFAAVSKAEGQGGGSHSEVGCACNQSGSEVDQPSKGNPVNTATGDQWDTTTDQSVPGAGLPLAFTRTYDADLAQQQAAPPTSPGPLGYGWTDNLGMSVSYNSTANPPVATVTEENGAQITFNPTSGDGNAWCAGLTTTFCPTSPRVIASLTYSTTLDAWIFVREVGGNTTFTFDGAMTSVDALTSIQDANLDKLQAATEAAGTGKCPSSATTCTAWSSVPAGQSAEGSLTLAYDATGQLVSVTDQAGNETTFCYYGQSCAAGAPSGGGQADDLYQATAAASSGTPLATTYTYDKSNSNTDLQHDLLTATPPGATVSGLGQTQNVYNSSGQISQQTQPDGEVDTYTYAGSEDTVAGGTTTVVSYPEGTGSPSTTTVYGYDDGVLNAETVNGTTEYFNRDPVSLLSISTEDLDGNVASATLQTGGAASGAANITTSTDAAGNTTADAYTSFNQPWCEIDAADYAAGATCPSTEPTWPPTTSYPGVTINYYNTADAADRHHRCAGRHHHRLLHLGCLGGPQRTAVLLGGPRRLPGQRDLPRLRGHPRDGHDHRDLRLGRGDRHLDQRRRQHHQLLLRPTVVPVARRHPDHRPRRDGHHLHLQQRRPGHPQVVTFGTYSATTVTAYDSDGREYCTSTPSPTPRATPPVRPPPPARPRPGQTRGRGPPSPSTTPTATPLTA